VVLLVALAVVLVVAKALGSLCTRLGQPAVIGEIIAGILLGPTLLHGAIGRELFPSGIRPVLSALGNLGVVLFMFLVGLEFNRSTVRRQFGAVLSVTVGSIAVPFGLGVLLAVVWLGRHSPGHGAGYALFLGTAMSVTAFPVLARMISDRGIGGTRVAGIALISAAIGDLLAWSMLAVAITVAGGGAQWRILLAVPLLAVVFLVVRPLLARWAARRAEGEAHREFFVVVLAGLLGCSALTEWMGLHFIFGAFLFGLVVGQQPVGGLGEQLAGHIEQVGAHFLLPVYFVVAGAQVDLSRLDLPGLGDFGLIMLVAVGGKFLGAMAGARSRGIGWRRAAVVGALMNTRGLTELVILTTGLQLGLVDQQLYSLMVLMAVVTTVMAGPLLRVLYPRHQVDLDLVSDPRWFPGETPVTTGRLTAE
jgi:Kef-type K+ transport system membrane component KefB